MKKPADHNNEWFQVTITLGNFYSRDEADQAIQSLRGREDFISGEVNGSWQLADRADQ